MFDKEDLLYICSPLSAPTRELIGENMRKAGQYAQLVSRQFGCRAIAPHSFLPEYLDDNIPREREVALEFGLSVLEISKAMIVCGNRISRGMAGEIRRAKELQIPVFLLVELGDTVTLVCFEEKEAVYGCTVCKDHLSE